MHVCVSERQKKRKVEQMEDGIEELKERLRLTQMQLQAEREADSLRRRQVSLCLNQDPASHIALNLLNTPIFFYVYFQCLVLALGLILLAGIV